MKYIFSIFLLLTTAILSAWLTPQAYRVHYHANMAVYINGQKWDFSLPKYMEETERCNVVKDVRPEDRIHLHEQNGETVHVHMAASTWGDLLNNLYWDIGNDRIMTDDGKEFRTGSGKNLYYIINGEQSLLSVANTPVKSEDQLLIYYGTGSFEEVMKNIYPQVSNNAHEYNEKQDPASCSANADTALLGGFIDNMKLIWEQLKEKFPHGHN